MNKVISNMVSSIHSPDIDLMLVIISDAVASVNIKNGLGDKPRAVGVELAGHHLILKHKQNLQCDHISVAVMGMITDIWDTSAREEGFAYQHEIFQEFLLGINFLDEAISYS